MTDLVACVEQAVVVDFESDQIAPRPGYPPVPCGVAIKVGAEPARYYAWGHHGHLNPDGFEVSLAALRSVWQSERPLLFHHSKFDVVVGVERLGLPEPAWQRVHDTLPMLFLLDPRALTYSLKPSAEKLLDWPPEERDAVIDWLLEHQPVAGVKLSPSPRSPTYAGAYIAWAPPDLVGKYAIGDVERTRALALWAAPKLVVQDMVAPYLREMRLQPIIMAMERRGIRVDVAALERDLAQAELTVLDLDIWLRERLGVDTDEFNPDSNDDLAQALVACGAATRAGLGVTPKSGKLQTNKEAFARGIVDEQLKAVLRYRAALLTATTTFMGPWLATARANGRIYTTWNSTRVSRDQGNAGARTGRFSSNPNFQNIPKEVKPLFVCAKEPKLPLPPFPLPELPRVRQYVLPEEGHVIVGRDFSSQELRVLAHYEDSTLCAAYRQEPGLDLHQYVANTLTKRGFPTERRLAKNIHFAVIYGVGIGHLAEILGCSVAEARAILAAYYAEFPSVRELSNDTKKRWRLGQPVRTWGGRLYYPEPPHLVDGRLRGWEYKALNVVVQGSSADLTKEAMIDYGESDLAIAAPLILTVHDELVVTAPWAERGTAMARLQEAMNRDRLDVPMLSDGYTRATWEGGEPQEPPHEYEGPAGSNTDPLPRVMP